MIDNIFGGDGEYLQVYNNQGYMPYINTTQPMNGMVRCTNNRLEVYDGSTWHTIAGSTANVALTPIAIEILKWAEKKRLEEKEAQALAQEFPEVREALELQSLADEYLRRRLTDAIEKKKVVEILAKE